MELIAKCPQCGSCFNPTLVRLRPAPWLVARWCPQRFQSHAGSIEACLPHPSRGGCDAGFQSHAGSIEAVAANTILDAAIVRFQSHAGSIEARDRSSGRRCRDERFNPTLVRLRPRKRSGIPGSCMGFNPTLVRLRPQPSIPSAMAAATFQSHAGSIEAVLIVVAAETAISSFNPTLVRLRRSAR